MVHLFLVTDFDINDLLFPLSVFSFFSLWFHEESNDQGRASVSRSRNWPQFPFHPRAEQARKN